MKSAASLVAIACGSPSPAQPMEHREVASLQAAVAVAEVPAELQSFPGHYAFTGGETERRGMAEAIEAVVTGMNPLARGIARDRLLASNKIAERVTIAVQGNEVMIAFDDRTYTAVLGAAAVEVIGLTGDPLQLTHRLDGKRLLQTFDGDKGGRRNIITRRGKHLRLAVTVHSESLPRAIQYQLTFTRK